MTRLDIKPASRERWPDLVDLFERRGPRGGRRNAPAYGCWCMYWRRRDLPHGEPKKRALAALVRAGREPGLLAYDGGVPIGWASVAPREEFDALLRSPQYGPREHEEGVWSIVCFAVDRDARGRGFAGALLDAAVAHARARGGLAVEAYPHVSNAADYMGSPELFRAHGFAALRPAGKRVIVRRGV